MNRHNKNGSCLLTVIIIITLISILSLNVWRMTVMTSDIALKKQLYEQQIQPLQSIMKWGIAIAKNNFDMIYAHAMAQKSGYTMKIPALNSNTLVYTIGLTFKAQSGKLYLETQLFNLNKPVYILSCLINKHTQKNVCCYEVTAWTAHGA